MHLLCYTEGDRTERSCIRIALRTREDALLAENFFVGTNWFFSLLPAQRRVSPRNSVEKLRLRLAADRLLLKLFRLEL